MTGQPVDIDRAVPGDLEAVRGFYARLGDTSTYYRFFGLRRHIPEGELRAVVGESADHVTLLATIDHELIGIGEYIVGRRPTEAEVAFAIADDHHREGVATLLLERLAVIAHDRGLARPQRDPFSPATPTCNWSSEPSASPSAAASTTVSSKSSSSSPP